MTTKSNKIKAEFLGMPHGTASGQLRKKILLRLLQRLEEDVCFRCGEKIINPEDLSIEHKKPWLYISVDLFWDLDNVAFFHINCNSGARRNTGKLQKGTFSMGYCYMCKKDKPIKEMIKCKTRWNGMDHICKECKSTKNKSRKR